MTILELIESKEPLEPETLHQLYPDLKPIEIEQIQVIKLIKNTDVVFEDMDVFENAVQVLNKIKPNIATTEGCTPEWIWKALNMINRIRPDKEYSDEVQAYIKAIYREHGYQFYPPLSGIDNPKFVDIVNRAIKGPFPLADDAEGIQAMRYLKIQEYLKGDKK